MGDVPDIAIARIDLVSRRSDRDSMRLGVSKRILAATDVPLAPRCNDGEVRSKRRVSELEAALVVALPCAAVGERVGTDLASNFNLPTGDKGPTHRSAEEVFTPVDSTSPEGGPYELFHEFLAQIFDVALIGTRCDRLCSYSLQLFALPDVRRDADDTSAVAFLEPRNDDGSVEPTGVGKGNCTDHGRLNKYSE